MPKEHMQAAPLYEPLSEGDGATVHTRTIEVMWFKDGDGVTLTPGWHQSSHPDGRLHPDGELLPDPADSDTARSRTQEGWFALEAAARTLNWKQCNDLIKILKRARDDTYGRPE